MKLGSGAAFSFKLLDPLPEGRDFGLDLDHRCDVRGATQFDQTRCQPFRAGKRLGGFGEPLFLNLIPRPDSVHWSPLPPPPLVASNCETVSHAFKTDAIYTAMAPI